MQKRYYTVAQFHEQLGGVITKAQIYNLIKRGEYPSRKIGKKIVLPAEWVDKYIQLPCEFAEKEVQKYGQAR